MDVKVSEFNSRRIDDKALKVMPIAFAEDGEFTEHSKCLANNVTQVIITVFQKAHRPMRYRAQGSYGFWKVMENSNAIFQDLRCFGNERLSEWLWKSFGFLFGKVLQYPKMGKI